MKLESTLRPRRGLLHFASLLDVLFLLLLFFLLASNAVVRSGIAVTPPQSRSALRAAPDADLITLSAGDPAQIFFNEKPVDLEELEAELADGSGGGGRRQIVIRGDERASLGQVLNIVNMAVEYGYKPIIATRPDFAE